MSGSRFGVEQTGPNGVPGTGDTERRERSGEDSVSGHRRGQDGDGSGNYRRVTRTSFCVQEVTVDLSRVVTDEQVWVEDVER